MNDPYPPPSPPEQPLNYQKPRDPKDFSSGTKVGLTFLGGGYSLVAAFIVVALVANNSDIPLGTVVGVIFLSVPVLSFFFRGLRFFGLGAALALVFGCLLPFGAILVICGRAGLFGGG